MLRSICQVMHPRLQAGQRNYLFGKLVRYKEYSWKLLNGLLHILRKFFFKLKNFFRCLQSFSLTYSCWTQLRPFILCCSFQTMVPFLFSIIWIIKAWSSFKIRRRTKDMEIKTYSRLENSNTCSSLGQSTRIALKYASDSYILAI